MVLYSPEWHRQQQHWQGWNQFRLTRVFLSAPRYDGWLPCPIHLSVRLWIMNPYSWAAKKNTTHGNEMLRKILRLMKRPRYQSLCQDPAGNQTTWRSPDHHKEMQIEVVQTHLPFIRSGQNVLQGTLKGGRRQGRQKKRWKTMSGNGQAWSLPSPRGQWRTKKNGGNW